MSKIVCSLFHSLQHLFTIAFDLNPVLTVSYLETDINY